MENIKREALHAGQVKNITYKCNGIIKFIEKNKIKTIILSASLILLCAYTILIVNFCKLLLLL